MKNISNIFFKFNDIRKRKGNLHAFIYLMLSIFISFPVIFLMLYVYFCDKSERIEIMNPIIILIIFVCLLVLLYLNQKQKRTPQHEEISIYPYAQKHLLTRTEYNFYKSIREYADKNSLLICPKVRMEDFVQVTDKENTYKYRGYIKSRHIDFLICDDSLYLLCGIELDDKSHNSQKAQTTDNFKDNVFNAIGIPLHRVKVSNNYDADIERILDSILS